MARPLKRLNHVDVRAMVAEALASGDVLPVVKIMTDRDTPFDLRVVAIAEATLNRYRDPLLFEAAMQNVSSDGEHREVALASLSYLARTYRDQATSAMLAALLSNSPEMKYSASRYLAWTGSEIAFETVMKQFERGLTGFRKRSSALGFATLTFQVLYLLRWGNREAWESTWFTNYLASIDQAPPAQRQWASAASPIRLFLEDHGNLSVKQVEQSVASFMRDVIAA